jgi:hypothetical protein
MPSVASSPVPSTSSSSPTASSPKSYAAALHLTPFSRPISRLGSFQTHLYSLKPVTTNPIALSRQLSVTPKNSTTPKRPRSSPSTSPTSQSPPEKRQFGLSGKSSQKGLKQKAHQISVTKHEGQYKKSWQLPEAKKSLLVIGDSNLGRISSSPTQDVQIQSYPGAHFHHMTDILKEYQHTAKPDNLIISIGINNRSSEPKTTSFRQLQTMLNAANKFAPKAKIYIPIINFSHGLLPEEKRRLNELNKAIEETKKAIHIPPLSYSDFNVRGFDRIHWTRDTANGMLQHWINHLN